MTLDRINKKILRELIGNSRLSFREVAKRVGASAGTVLARVSKMEKEGIIKGYSMNADHEKLGYELTAITEVTVAKGKIMEMEREIAKLSPTCAVYDVTGVIDAIIIAKFRNRQELSTFAKKLLSMPFVERTNTHVVLTTVKEDFRLEP